MTFYVTTSLHASVALAKEALFWVKSYDAHYIERKSKTIQTLFDELNVQAFIIYTAQGPQIITQEGAHSFQLSMAELRIQQLRKGAGDHLLSAIQAQGPVTFLDCTCGFAADSIVVSFGLPVGSKIIGLEISPLLYAVTNWGLQNFSHKKSDVTAALRRIELVHEDYRDYLSKLPDNGLDVIYFDPMFSHPVESSPQFSPVRSLMDHSQLNKEIIELALQKARCRVIIKARRFQELRKTYPAMQLYGGKYSKIGYAVLEKTDG